MGRLVIESDGTMVGTKLIEESTGTVIENVVEIRWKANAFGKIETEILLASTPAKVVAAGVQCNIQGENKKKMSCNNVVDMKRKIKND